MDKGSFEQFIGSASEAPPLSVEEQALLDVYEAYIARKCPGCSRPLASDPVFGAFCKQDCVTTFENAYRTNHGIQYDVVQDRPSIFCSAMFSTPPEGSETYHRLRTRAGAPRIEEHREI